MAPRPEAKLIAVLAGRQKGSGQEDGSATIYAAPESCPCSFGFGGLPRLWPKQSEESGSLDSRANRLTAGRRATLATHPRFHTSR
jgi:hypothetical protein